MGARQIVSAVTAGATALIVGTLIATVSDAAHATDVAKAASARTEANVSAAADAQSAAQLTAYRARLEDALAKLDTAYRELKDRDSAYRALVAKADGNAAALATANQDLAAKLQAAYAGVQQLTARVQRAEAAAAPRGTAASAPRGPERESEADDDD